MGNDMQALLNQAMPPLPEEFELASHITTKRAKLFMRVFP